MKFYLFFVNSTALQIAVDNGNTEIVQLLNSHPNIDINLPSVLNHYVLIMFYF